jgi:fatty acid desaturase
MTSYDDRWRAAQVFDAQLAYATVKDLLVPRMSIYWTDLILSAVIGWSGFALAVIFTPLHWLGILGLAVSVPALYRGALFIHELVHFRSKAHTRSFGRGWNALIGFWLLIPYFMYEGHAEHHSKRLYGTAFDAEYLPFARLSRREMVKVAAAALVLPLFGPIRFGILAPVSWLVPATRERVYARASTIKIDLEYRGHPPKKSQRLPWFLQELACFAIVWTVGVLIVIGHLPVLLLLCWYLLFVGVVSLNTMRLLGAHRYLGNDSDANIVLQMIDTINYPSSRIAGFFWGPIGLRLHALHHLVPSLPYHSFGKAHARLVAALPPDSAYRLTESPGLLAAVIALWRAPRSLPGENPFANTASLHDARKDAL